MIIGIIKTIIDNRDLTDEQKINQLRDFVNIYEKSNKSEVKDIKRDRVMKQRNAFLQLQLRNASPISHRKASYYVQYKEKVFDGKKQPKLIKGVFDCQTDNFEEALNKAIRYRDVWLEEYNKRQMEKEKFELYKILLAFYQPHSPYLKEYERIVNKKMSEDARTRHLSNIKNIYVPYLKNHRNSEGQVFDTLSKISEVDLNIFRKWVLTDYKNVRGVSLKPKSVENVMTSLKIIYTTMIFGYNRCDGCIKINPFDNFKVPLTRGVENVIHKPFNSSDYKKLFKMEWDNDLYYILCLIGFNTGLRNSEICRICLSDIAVDNNYYFLNVRGTKTKAAVRKVPLNRFTYLKIMEYAKKKEIKNELFPKGTIPTSQITFAYAVNYAGNLLGYSPEEMKSNGYSFYGFRSFYSTLLHNSKIDFLVVEYLMGHSNGTVAARYTNFDAIAGELFQPVVEKFDEYLTDGLDLLNESRELLDYISNCTNN